MHASHIQGWGERWRASEGGREGAGEREREGEEGGREGGRERERRGRGGEERGREGDRESGRGREGERKGEGSRRDLPVSNLRTGRTDSQLKKESADLH